MSPYVCTYVWTWFAFGISYQLIQAAQYGDRFNEISSLIQSKRLAWQPRKNSVFKDRDETEMKRFAGVNLSRKQQASPRRLGSSRRPGKGGGQMKGRGQYGSGRGRWRDNNRYKKNYWEHGSNRKGFGGRWGQQQGNVGGGGGRGNDRDGRGNGRGSNNKNDNNNRDDREFERKNGGGGRGEHGRGKRDTLPKNFDWRDYSDCQSLDDIRYQECGDCWSVSSTSVMSDRYCLFTHKEKFFSARQVTTCVYPGEGGCDGGWPKDAMELYKTRGVASGGDPTVTDEPQGCLAYPDELTKDSACPVVCDKKSALDSTKAGDYYEITSKNSTEIMEEIYNYGPVVAVMEIFDDFGYMGTGVYEHVSGASQGYHAIRIIGFGEESGKPYWLVANSWGVDWGDKGYFKILRGTNHCDIESWVTCVYPEEAYG